MYHTVTILVTIIIITGLNWTTQDTATATGSNTSSCNSSLQAINNNCQQQCPNFTELANDVVQKLTDSNQQQCPNFTQLVNVIQKLNGDSQQQCPNSTELANNVIKKLTDSNQQQFPNFTQWSDDITTGVYQYLDPSLSSLSDDVSLNNNTLVLSLITQLNNTMQNIANKVDVIGKFNEEEETFHENNTLLLNRVVEAVSSSVIKLNSIIGSLSNIQDTSTSTAGVVDAILIVVQELLQLHNISSPLPTSCKQIIYEKPNSPSGMYLLVTVNGTITTYCDMGELCGLGGGWTRLAFLDMNDSTVNCPSGFRLYQSGGVRACGRPVASSGSCVSVQFPSNGISYSQVCGRVTGYQYYTPDAVDNYFAHNSSHNNLNGEYVDGVSITRGSPRQHVWTLMASGFERFANAEHKCPCSAGSAQQVESFIGNHYYCESGFTGIVDERQHQLYTSDPLWDGQNCGFTETACCNVTGIPWFHRDYGNTTTTDYIELRVCGDEGTDNEDVPVSYYEIYVQ